MNSKTNKVGRSRATIRTCKELNRDLTETQQVSPSVQTHYVNLATGSVGMRGLITEILRANGSIWRGGVSSPADRAAAIGSAMYTEDIIDQARIRFTGGTTRYPSHSIMACLGRTMLKRGEVGKIKLSPNEDYSRRCSRPRCKWYLARG
jgi:hypothetical protein